MTVIMIYMWQILKSVVYVDVEQATKMCQLISFDRIIFVGHIFQLSTSNWLRLETGGEIGSGLQCLQESYWWPMLHRGGGRRRLWLIDIFQVTATKLPATDETLLSGYC